MVASIGLGDAYGIEGAGADDFSRRRGHHDGERDVFTVGVAVRSTDAWNLLS